MSRRRRQYTIGGDEGINLTPLLDVIFNLIFFFVVATTIRTDETFFDLTLPTANEGDERPQVEKIPTVAVSQDGSLALNGIPIDPEDLPDQLRQMTEPLDEKRVVFSADGAATVQQSVDAMDLIREAGITEIIQRVAVER